MQLVLEDKLDGSQQGPTYTTEKGVQIQADVVYWTVGLIPSTGFLKSENILDSKGFIKVTPLASSSHLASSRMPQHAI